MLNTKCFFFLYKDNFIRTLCLKFFQKQEQIRNIKYIYTCVVILSCVKNEIFIEVLLWNLPWLEKFLFVRM